MSKLRLTEITMTTKDGQFVRLTLDEARDLHAQLAELFAPKAAPVQPWPILIERDRWPAPWRPYAPMWVSPSTGDPLPPLPYVTCSAPSGLRTHFVGYET